MRYNCTCLFVIPNKNEKVSCSRKPFTALVTLARMIVDSRCTYIHTSLQLIVYHIYFSLLSE